MSKSWPDEKHFRNIKLFLTKRLNVAHDYKKTQNELNSECFYFQINRAKLPYWKMTLLNVCNLVNNINNQMGETVEVDEEDLVPGRQFPAALDGFSLEAMLTIYQLQKVCHSRAFQHWEVTQIVTKCMFLLLLNLRVCL